MNDNLNKGLTTSLIDVLFKIYDLPDYRLKAFSALPTTDNALASAYNIKLSGDLPSNKIVKQVD